MKRFRVFLWLVLGLVFIAGPTVSRWYTDWLWFAEVGYLRVFWVPFLSRVGVTLVVGVALGLLLYVNVRPVLRAARPAVIDMTGRGGVYRPSRGRWDAATVWWGWALAAVALIAGYNASRHWVALLQYLHAEPFGTTDPLFGRDVGFYVFALPVYRWVTDGLFGWLVVIALGAAAGYAAAYGRLMLRGVWLAPSGVRMHLSALVGAAVLVRGLGFWLDTFDLLYSTRGPVFGASFTDVHAVLPVLRLLTVLFVICGLLLVANGWMRTVRLAAAAMALIAVAWFGGLVLYPGLVQALRVRPNELTAEAPFIARAIAATRAAFGLDRIREREFPALPLDPADITRNLDTVQNVRLWDYRPMLSAINQLQTLRPYYTFSDVDIDRYTIAGTQRQVMLSARELAVHRLPVQARNWVNEHLVYTHGYGVVMTPVNRVSEEGMPEFYIRDVPPKSSVGIAIARPEIYYGELTTNFVVVNTRVPELDYPRGEDNVYTRYQGTGGIRMGYLARLAFAYRFGDMRLLLSRDIHRDSRLLFRRQIVSRVTRIAPFLRYDRDPYMVIAGGRLVWILDAYTATDRFPYATRYGDINYMRNSVKVAVDAYDGTVTFYLMTPEEPIVRTLAAIFPTLFRPASQMPAEIAAHLRYPVDLFEVQVRVFSTFHMRDPQVLYNREDVWTVPREVFGNEAVPVEPYYVTMRLAEGAAPEFVLMLPLVPSGRDNMIAWMAARNDPPHYGEVIVYRFPKGRIVFGPLQVEARIDQDPLISSQITLWNQQGSRVIRGNLLVIPIEEGLLYVEPLFLQAERGQIPELRRVIAASGPKIVMAPTLDAALVELFGEQATTSGATRGARSGSNGPLTPGGTSGEAPALAGLRALTEEALEIYRRAQERLRAGDFTGYSQEIERLGRVLEQLQAATRQR
jgi:uncharacterized membrane protein (UPF0182 family)